MRRRPKAPRISKFCPIEPDFFQFQRLFRPFCSNLSHYTDFLSKTQEPPAFFAARPNNPARFVILSFPAARPRKTFKSRTYFYRIKNMERSAR